MKNKDQLCFGCETLRAAKIYHSFRCEGDNCSVFERNLSLLLPKEIRQLEKNIKNSFSLSRDGRYHDLLFAIEAHLQEREAKKPGGFFNFSSPTMGFTP